MAHSIDILEFVSEVRKIYGTGAATEHSYRATLQSLFSSIDADIVALNEPKRVKCGAPDFLINRGDIVVGHVEAKDIGRDLRTLKGAEASQKKRYLKALPNLVYTNCLDFEFYREGSLISRISIGDFLMGIQPEPDQYSALEHQLRDFVSQRPQTITSSEKLAEIMAGKAALIKDVLFKALREDKDLKTELANQYKAFQEHLIHDIKREDFADIYAETVAYGMFAARLHDDTLENFSRLEALELLPKSNPFLRALFTYIAGPDLDSSIKWIIDDLADVFRAANVKKIMEDFGTMTGRNDPFHHFYETFLAKYNPIKRKARGVWYTPEPVVNFIVRAVDDVLKIEFGLPMGLADTSKITIDWDTGQKQLTKKGKIAKSGKNAIEKKEVHRVQILDPATGTGTFLAEVIKQIAPRVRDIAEGMWSGYLEKELIPRLHGFELLMASYAMCHMKLDMILSELGYVPSSTPPRLGVYLTNSLEEGEPANQTLPFAQWLSNEVKEANAVKRDIPIMCVIGNPPYKYSSENNNPWISAKMADYKVGVHDRKINLNDDYMKFIRFAEDCIVRNSYGVVAMITNNSFLDGITQRGMRSHLINTFDRIDVYNLHGDIRTQQPDTSDQNVFDITQGVAITIFVKNRKSSGIADVRYLDLIGRRNLKYEALFKFDDLKNSLTAIVPETPYFFFVPKTFDKSIKTFSLDDLFKVKSSGIQTKNDAVAISWSSDERDVVLSNFRKLKLEELEKLYPPMQVWNTENARRDIVSGGFERRTILYRPFDKRFTALTQRSNGFLGRPRYDVMQHISEGDISLVINKKHVGDYFSHVFVADTIAAHGVNYLGNKGQDYICPIYISQGEVDGERQVNFNPQLWAKLQETVLDEDHGVPDELSIFDYIYGILHSPHYREKFAETLKIGFPDIPWPSSSKAFWNVVEKGRHLRRLHLMEPEVVGNAPFPFKGEGDAVVEKQRLEGGKVWINDRQHFDRVPKIAWEFYVGGYKPAQKWLKDRKGRQLSFDDIMHYQGIIKVLSETNRIMDSIEVQFGGS